MKQDCIIIQASKRAIITAAIVALKEKVEQLDFCKIIVVDLNKEADTLCLKAFQRLFVIDPDDCFKKIEKFVFLNHERLYFWYSNPKIDEFNKKFIKRFVKDRFETRSVNEYVKKIENDKEAKLFPLLTAIFCLDRPYSDPLSSRIHYSLKAAKQKELKQEVVLKILADEMILEESYPQIDSLLEDYKNETKEKFLYEDYIINHHQIGKVMVIKPKTSLPIEIFFKKKKSKTSLAVLRGDGNFEILLSRETARRLRKEDLETNLIELKRRTRIVVNKDFLFKKN